MFCNKNSKLAKLIIKYKCGIVIDYEDDQKLNFKKLMAFTMKLKSKIIIIPKTLKNFLKSILI